MPIPESSQSSIRFEGPPSSPSRGGRGVPPATPVDPTHQGDVVASAVPVDEEDLSDLLPDPVPPPTDGTTLLIHVLEDGFTANGQVWYRGQEIEYVVGKQPYEDTKDRNGKTWLEWDDAEQMRRWGKVNFRRGPWPGSVYEDPRAAAAELTRSRQPKALAGIAPSLMGR